MMRAFIQDLRHALRTFSKSPSFAFVAVLTLALGIGASATIFSVVNGVLLRPLPYSEPARLVHFASWSAAKGAQELDFTDNLFAFYRDRSHSFDSLAVYDTTGFNFTDKGEPERLRGATVTYDFFRVLGRHPIYGRSFLPQEDTPGNNSVTVISYELWQRRFGSDPLVVGRSIDLNNVPTIIVGIMPPGFDFPKHTDLWVPVGLNPQTANVSWYLNPIGRLRPGVTMASANQEVAALWDDYAREMKWPKAGPDAPAAVVLASGGVEAIKTLPPSEVPRLDQVHLDPRFLFFTFGVAIFTGLLLGLAPALRAARVNVNEAVKDGARGSAPASTRRLSNAFVIA